MTIWENDEINGEQEDAITDPGNILLVACPGSGKTRTLTYKIAYELNKLTARKEYLIALTYTNNAADEIKERVELLGVDTSQLWIGTIHSFCLEWILRPYHQYLNDLKNGFSVINSHESEAILTELCRPYSRQRITYYDCGILATPTDYYPTCLDTRKHEYIKVIISEYFKILKEKRKIDFEQILFHSFQLLTSKPIICSILSNLFPFILIDEYQDTKEIQYHIISKILNSKSSGSKVFIVGDPNQSIYQSLGGYPMKQNELEQLFGFQLKGLGLTKNYRSSQKIIQYFDRYSTHKNTVISSGLHKEYQSTISYNNLVPRGKLIDEIARLIEFNVQEKKIPPNEICIVAPQWIHLASITRSLMIKLPDYSFDGPGMAPFSRDIDNFWFKLSRIVLTEPSPFMYVKRLRWSREVIYELNLAGFDVSEITSKGFLKICNSIVIGETDGLKYLAIFFKEVCKILKLEISRYPALLDHHNSFFESSQDRISRLIKEGNEFIGRIENFRKVFKQRDGVTVSTIHGVKGEEYDTVIGFALLNDYVPHFSDPNGDENSKKLLYVLSSRARKNLHLISETGRDIHLVHRPNGKSPTPHLLHYDYKYDKV